MQISLNNFGGFNGSHVRTFESQTLKNGLGKTTLINAYVFALSGKTLNGFVAGNTEREEGSTVSVTLQGFFYMPPIRRVLKDDGTTLYIGDDVVTQTDFNQTMELHGYDVDFIVACANANVLTSNGLDAETLRKILTKADVLQSDEHDALKKRLADVRKKLKTAESHALTNVIVPAETCEDLTQSEREFVTKFKNAQVTVNDGIVTACPHCNHTYDEKTVNEVTESYNDAETIVQTGMQEFTRIANKFAERQNQQREIADAKRILELSASARKDALKYASEVNDILEELRELNENAIAMNLPEYVEVITEITQKNGSTKPTCTLEYRGVPLRSINHAKRIEICVAILDHARTAKGMQNVPIVVDNAEAITSVFEQYKNIVLFKAG